MGEVNSDLLDFKGREEVCLVSLKCNLSSMCFSSVGNMSRLGGVLLLILEGISILVKPKGLPSLYRDDNLLHGKKKTHKNSFTSSLDPHVWGIVNSTVNGQGLPLLIGRA